MNREEAIQLMKNGKKVTHRYFDNEEYIKMKDGKIYDENGYGFFPNEFWQYRTEIGWDRDWSVYS